VFDFRHGSYRLSTAVCVHDPQRSAWGERRRLQFVDRGSRWTNARRRVCSYHASTTSQIELDRRRIGSLVVMPPPPIILSYVRHYVFELSVRLCVFAYVRARAEVFSNRHAVDFYFTTTVVAETTRGRKWKQFK